MTAALWALPVIPLLLGSVLVAAARLPVNSTGRIAIPAGVVALVLTAVDAAVVCVRRPSVDLTWVPQVDMRLRLGVDGVSIPLIALTVGVGLLALVQALHERPQGGTRTSYSGCVLLVVGGALATFLARDVVIFFLAFEVVLVPMWVLITKFGDRREPEQTRRAARLFLLYTVLGSTLMLVGILTLVHLSGTSDMNSFAQHVPPHWQTVAAILLVVGLAIKVPIWPLHSWLPAAHTAAPTGGSMLLAAVLLKMGTYGIFRLVVPLHHGWHVLAPYVAGFAVTGIVWAGLVCLAEPSLKRLIAWSSVGHMGFVVLGLASGSVLGVQAALFGNIAHGVISALLFAIVGGLKLRWHGDDLEQVRTGLRDHAPRLGFGFLLAAAAAAGLPALAGFWAEFLAILASWSSPGHTAAAVFRGYAVVAAVGAVLAGAYAVRILRRVWAGERQDAEGVVDASVPESLVIGCLIAAVVGLGVWPTVVLDLMHPVVQLLAGGAR